MKDTGFLSVKVSSTLEERDSDLGYPWNRPNKLEKHPSGAKCVEYVSNPNSLYFGQTAAFVWSNLM